jgi:multidrug efflux pump subunit AcrA (membrane-fusion protein)
VFPYADPVTHSFRVRVELKPGHHGLYPGMMVKVAFVIGKIRQLRVPLSAVVHRGEVTAVYIMEDGHVSLRQIRIGQRDSDGKVVVLSGLSEGDQVVMDPIAAGVLLKKQWAGKSK